MNKTIKLFLLIMLLFNIYICSEEAKEIKLNDCFSESANVFYSIDKVNSNVWTFYVNTNFECVLGLRFKDRKGGLSAEVSLMDSPKMISKESITFEKRKIELNKTSWYCFMVNTKDVDLEFSSLTFIDKKEFTNYILKLESCKLLDFEVENKTND